MITFFQIINIVSGISLLVFIHEFGHFIVAKIFKVRILTFAFGFGPDLVKSTYNGTKYCIKIIPFGGFVSMAGENPKDVKGLKDEYLSLKWYKKVLIAFAGPFSNYIFAVFLFIFIFNVYGVQTISINSSIGAVVKNYPAEFSGLLPGDKIKSIDGIKVDKWNDLCINIRKRANKRAFFIIDRKGHSFELSIPIAKDPITKLGAIGITPVVIKTKISFFKSLYLGVKTLVIQIVMTVVYLVDKLISFEKPSIAGPIGVIHTMVDATKNGAYSYVKLIAIISTALGLFNLLPIPMVDGGMIILFLVEGLSRKQMKMKFIQIYNGIGLIFIITIFLFATYNDLIRLNVDKLFR
ncbi:MAG: site-2 protease family protein [Endomicrobium sp.]|jgi:regulator of sigma E protease|nr:site-2 protease family protein [Endomicrobium sp.]